VLLDGELVDTRVPPAAPAVELVEEERSGREDRSKQIWQLLTLELWYRQAVGGRGGDPVKQVAQNYKSGELSRARCPDSDVPDPAGCWCDRSTR
jgi:hypothetical protein